MADFYVSENGEYYEIVGNNLISENGEMILAITLAAPAVPVTGNPIGLLLALTYTI